MFTYAGPCVWNSLAEFLRLADCTAACWHCL